MHYCQNLKLLLPFLLCPHFLVKAQSLTNLSAWLQVVQLTKETQYFSTNSSITPFPFPPHSTPWKISKEVHKTGEDLICETYQKRRPLEKWWGINMTKIQCLSCKSASLGVLSSKCTFNWISALWMHRAQQDHFIICCQETYSMNFPRDSTKYLKHSIIHIKNIYNSHKGFGNFICRH